MSERVDVLNSVGASWRFWQTVKEISPKVVVEEAGRGFKFALVGSQTDCERLVQTLLTEKATEKQKSEVGSLVRFFETTPDEDTARGFSFVVYVGRDDEPIGLRGANSVPLSGALEAFLVGVLTLRPDLAIALPRRLPLFQAAAADLLIQRTAKVNAQISLFSSLAWLVPTIAPVLGYTGIADVLLLTKNQAMLIMRLAALYGQRPGYTHQVKEILATVASALGWRTLARGLAGLIPAGAGIGIKAGIAYSGTVAVGKAAQLYYTRGTMPTSEEIKQAYEESKNSAKSVEENAESTAEKLLTDPKAALPIEETVPTPPETEPTT